MSKKKNEKIPLDEESIEEKKVVTTTDYDGAWKHILDHYFPLFMAFFFPDVHSQIDWSREYQVLDQELNKIARDSKVKKRYTDKLIKVWHLDGEAQWVLIHIEIQSQKKKGFEQRVYVYYYRLRDLYDLPVSTFVVLGDTNEEWMPSKYEEELWGTKLSFEYPVVKLREYWDRWAELEQSTNPFAIVVMAHLQAQQTHNNPESRYDIKLDLTRRLYQKGYKRQEVENLFKFIDWLMWLPEEMEPEFWQKVEEIEEGVGMEYLHTGERLGYKRGKEEGLEKGLEKGRGEGRLETKIEMILRLIDHRFALEDELLKRTIAKRVALIKTESELDELIDLALMQPSLPSLMTYLPELDNQVVSDEGALD